MEYWLVLWMISRSAADTPTITTVPAPFATIDECKVAGELWVPKLADGTSSKMRGFSCLPRKKG